MGALCTYRALLELPIKPTCVLLKNWRRDIRIVVQADKGRAATKNNGLFQRHAILRGRIDDSYSAILAKRHDSGHCVRFQCCDDRTIGYVRKVRRRIVENSKGSNLGRMAQQPLFNCLYRVSLV